MVGLIGKDEKIMANRYAGTPLNAEWDAIQRRREVNQALLEQAMADTGPTQFVRGGRLGPTQAVPYSWGTGAGQIGKALIAGMSDKKAREREKEVSGKYDASQKESVDKFMGLLKGKPAGFEGGSIPGRYNEAQPPDPEGAMVHAGTDPYMQSPGMQNVITAMTKPAPKQTFKTEVMPMGDGVFQKRKILDGQDVGPYGSEYRRDPRASSTNVKVNTQGDVTQEGTKKYWGGVGTRAVELQKSAHLGVEQNHQLDRMKLAMGRGAATGFGQEFILNAKSFFNTVGLQIGDLSKMGEQEIVLSTGNKLALLVRNPESGMGLPGSTSNRDVTLLFGAVPGLSKTKAGNLKLIDIAKRSNDLKVDAASYATNIINKNGGKLPADYEIKMLDFMKNYEMFTDNEMAEIQAISSGDSQLVNPTKAINAYADPEEEREYQEFKAAELKGKK